MTGLAQMTGMGILRFAQNDTGTKLSGMGLESLFS